MNTMNPESTDPIDPLPEDTDRAIVNYEAAMNANAQLNRPDFDAITLANVSSLRAERGEFDIAIEIGERALALCRIHAVGFLPEVLAALAGAYGGRGEFDQARTLLNAALAMLDASSVSFDDAVRSSVELAFGRVELCAKNDAEALSPLNIAPMVGNAFSCAIGLDS